MLLSIKEHLEKELSVAMKVRDEAVIQLNHNKQHVRHKLINLSKRYSKIIKRCAFYSNKKLF